MSWLSQCPQGRNPPFLATNGLSRPAVYRIQDEGCQGSSVPGDGETGRGMDSGTRPL